MAPNTMRFIGEDVANAFAAGAPKEGLTSPVSADIRLALLARETYCVICRSIVDGFGELGDSSEVLSRLDVVGAGRRKARCPVCRSRDRDRLVYLFLESHTTLLCSAQARDRPRLLHLAPEPQLEAAFGAVGLERYDRGDINPRVGVRQMDVRALPYPDAAFDVVICNHVLEHVVEDRQAMSELRRVLRGSGWGLLQVPIARALKRCREDPSISTDEGRRAAFGRADHVRVYTQPDYVNRLEDSGFRVVALRSSFQLSDAACTLLGLDAREQLFLVAAADHQKGAVWPATTRK